MAFGIGPQIRYASDGQRTYNKNGELVTHHGYFETLADQLAAFTRASVAYKQDGSQVAAGVPRYEYARQPAPVWQDTFDTDQLADEYTSGGDTPASWTVSGGILTGTGGANAALIKNDLLLQDCEIEINSDQANDGGIIARYQDDNNYYLLHFSDDSGPVNNFRLYKRVAGTFIQIVSTVNVTWARGTSKPIKFTLHGSRIEAWFDGQKVISFVDTAFLGGGIGFRNSGSTAFRVLDFKVYKATKAVMVEEGTANLLTANQASVETDTTGFSTIGATMARVTTEKWHGTASLQVTYPGSATDERVVFEVNPVTASQAYTYSIRLKGTAGTKARLVLREKNSEGATIGDTVVDVTLTGAWQKESVTRTFGASGVRAEMQVRNAATGAPYTMTVYADGMGLFQKAYPTSWQLPGTARAGEILTIPTSVLNTDKGTIEFDVVVDPSVHTAAASWAMAFAISDADEKNQIRFAKRHFSVDWSAKFSDSAGATWSPIISSVVMTHGTYRVALKWNRSTTTAKVLVDGVVVTSNTSAPLPSSFASASGGVAYVGRWISTAYCLNSLIGNLRISNIDREDSEIAAAYAIGLPLTVDQYTTYLMSMDGHLQPTVRGFGLWSKNGRHILHDPQSGQGIEVWDDNSLKVLIGLLANGKIGIKTTDGEIYSGKFQTGNENSNTYIALNSNGTLSAYYNGKQNLGMWPNQSWGNIEFYENGNPTGQLYASNENDPVLGGTKRRFVVWSKGDGSLKLDGPGIELDSDYVRLASSTSAQITVRGKIRDNLLPAYDSNGYVGQEDLRWNTVRAEYITSGDLCFEEGFCPICEQSFAPGDIIALTVQHIHEEHHTMCIPIHDRCKGIPKTITVEVPETEKRYRLGKDGQIEVYHTTKFQEVEEQIHKIKDDYSIDEKTGEFKKKAVDQPATKDEAVEVVTVKKRVPVMKTVKVELNAPANI